MRYGIALALLSLGLISAQGAWAASSKAKASEKTARKACLSGDYTKGVSILSELFVDTGNPIYLFNQARCYEQNLRYAEAAERFKEYLRKAPDLGDREKADVERRIADCETSAGIKTAPSESAKPAAVSPAAASEVAPQPIETKPEVPVPSAGEPAAPSAPEGRSWKSTAKWVAAGVAVGAAVFGGIEYYRYRSKNRDFNDAVCRPGECKDLADAADKAQVLSIVGFSVAGAAAVGALVFWLTDAPSAPASAQAELGWGCLPSPTGLACHGSF